ncbi:MAG: 50S ribosomal protein L6 [Candidatus Micrarchaeia archaeon]
MQEIEIPQGIEASISGSNIVLKGKAGSAKKEFNGKFVNIKIEGNKVVIASTEEKKLKRKGMMIEKALAGEIKSMIESVTNKSVKKMKVLFAHFPMSLEVSGNILYIKNIFGERVPRAAKIVGDTKVEIKGQDITVSGPDPYDVGQTVANIRKACYVKNKDTRVFQDGMYVVNEE